MAMSFNEVKRAYTKLIEDYISNDRIWDYGLYSKFKNWGINKEPPRVLEFAKLYLSEALYNAFNDKIDPFNIKEDGSNKEEKMALLDKVVEMGRKVTRNEANLIDICQELTDNIDEYLNMLKVATYKYKKSGQSVYHGNSRYVNLVASYRSPGIPFDIHYPGVSQEETQKVKNVIENTGLLLNNITYYAAFQYAKRKNIIKPNQVLR